MALSNMLKMMYNHFKKTYLIYSVAFLIIGGLLYIPGINNIKFDIVNLSSICGNAFLFSSLFLSAILGSIIFGEYGKTFSLILNNKTPLLLSGIICGIANSLLLTLVFLVFRLNNQSNNGFVFISLITIFFTFLCSFFFGSIYSLILKGKTKINLAIIIVLLTLCFSFKSSLSTYFNIYTILISEGFKNECLKIIIPLIISSIVLASASYMIYIKFN